MQRVADLEARVTALTAENEGLRARINGNGNGNGLLDIDKLIEAVGLRIDRSGQLLREDFTGKLAGLISPYIDKTLRQCDEVSAKQDDLEKKFKEHKKAVAGSAAELEASFVKIRKEANKDWTAQREKILEDLGYVDSFVKWFQAEMLKNAQHSNAAVASCNAAALRCQEVAAKMSVLAEETAKHLEALRAKGEESIKRAERSVTDAHKSVRPTVLKLAGLTLAAAFLIQMGFGAFTLWRNRALLDNNWESLTQHSEQQKKDIQGMFDEALKQVREAQIDSEIKAKMWDEIVKDLNPQVRIMKLRERVRAAGDKRLTDQMQAGYDQMNGKKK